MFEDEGVPFLDSRSGSGTSAWGKRLRAFADEKLPISRTAAVGVCVVALCVAVGVAGSSFASSGVLVQPQAGSGSDPSAAVDGDSAGQKAGGGDSGAANGGAGSAGAASAANAGGASDVAAGAGAGSAADASAQTLFVHVVGAVKQPGIYELAAGSRLADAIEAAGGPSSKAAVDAVNLARELSDGEQVSVPTKAQVAKEKKQQECAVPRAGASGSGSGGVGAAGSGGSGVSGSAASGAAGATGAAGASSGSGAQGGLINVNTATEAELQTISGIGPATAQKIVADREANGPFARIEDLTRVSGIGDKKLEAMRGSITVG